MVLEVPKDLKPSFSFSTAAGVFFYKFAKKSILGVIIALIPFLIVFGPGLCPGLGKGPGADGPGGPTTPSANPVYHSSAFVSTNLQRNQFLGLSFCSIVIF